MFRSSKTPSYDSSREALLKQRRRGSTVAATSSKGKPSAFNQSHSQSKGKRPHSATVSKEPKVRTIREVEDDDDDLNSGFGSYMRSGEGLEMMKLFILGNTLIIVVTFAWPHIYEELKLIRTWYAQPS